MQIFIDGDRDCKLQQLLRMARPKNSSKALVYTIDSEAAKSTSSALISVCRYTARRHQCDIAVTLWAEKKSYKTINSEGQEPHNNLNDRKELDDRSVKMRKTWTSSGRFLGE